jgi:hypothetical protein
VFVSTPGAFSTFFKYKKVFIVQFFIRLFHIVSKDSQLTILDYRYVVT